MYDLWYMYHAHHWTRQMEIMLNKSAPWSIFHCLHSKVIAHSKLIKTFRHPLPSSPFLCRHLPLRWCVPNILNEYHVLCQNDSFSNFISLYGLSSSGEHNFLVVRSKASSFAHKRSIKNTVFLLELSSRSNMDQFLWTDTNSLYTGGDAAAAVFCGGNVDRFIICTDFAP